MTLQLDKVVNMRCKLTVIALVVALLAGCDRSAPTASGAEWIAPSNAVQLAAASPDDGVTGVFYMTVKGTGMTDRLHLNSESDYRDQRNLSVAVEPAAAKELAEALGAPPQFVLRGKRILVIGTAKRARIEFTAGGRPTNKYYFQTHVLVKKASQTKLL